jgi:hypothetical protein
MSDKQKFQGRSDDAGTPTHPGNDNRSQAGNRCQACAGMVERGITNSPHPVFHTVWGDVDAADPLHGDFH